MQLKLIFAISILMINMALPAWSADCWNAYSYADDIYSNARKGSKADDLEEAHFFAKKAMIAAEKSIAAAKECGCDDAYTAAGEAFQFARKSYQSDDFDYAVHHLNKAQDSAEDARSYADDCGT